MNGKVQGVYMNLRYRILTIDEQSYILDMGRPFWKILFPFFYWILSNTAYKVNDHELIEKIKTPEVKQQKLGGAGVMAGLIGVFLANLLRPLANVFNIPSTPLVNSVIVLIVLLLVPSIFLYINSRSKKSLYKMIDLEENSTIQIRIKPQSHKHFFYVFFFYLSCLLLTVVPFLGFIQTGDILIFFIGVLFLFITLIISFLTVAVGETTVTFAVGETTVTFKNDTKAV